MLKDEEESKNPRLRQELSLPQPKPLEGQEKTASSLPFSQ